MPAPSLLDHLECPDGAALRAQFRERHYRRGEAVCLPGVVPGSEADQVFIVLQGRLRVFLVDAARELTLAYLQPGDVYTTHTPAHVCAQEPSCVALIATRTFSAHLGAHSPVAVAVMRLVGVLLDRTVELIDALVFREVPQRLARLLLTLARRQAHEQTDGSWRLALPFTLTDIAALLGSTRQSVSAAWAGLERAGLIERQGRRELRLLDLARLEALAAGEEVSAG